MKKAGIILLVLLAITQLSAQNRDSLLQVAKKYCGEQQVNKAFKIFHKVLKKDSADIPAKLEMGKCYFLLGDTAKGLKYYRSALKLDSVNVMVNLALIKYYLNVGKILDAEKLFNCLKNYSPQNDTVKVLQGILYLFKGDRDSAKKVFKKITSTHPKNISVYQLIAWAYTKLENYDTAKIYLTKAIRISPHNAKLYLQRSQVEIQAEQYPQAIKDLDTAIAIQPYNKRLYLEKMSVYLYWGKYDTASVYGLKQISKLKDSTFYFLLGFSMIKSNKFTLDSVKKIIQQGIKYSKSAELYYLLGLIYQLKHNFDSAYVAFSKAVKMQPWNIKYTKEMIASNLMIHTKDLKNYKYFRHFNPNNFRWIKRHLRKHKSRYYYQKLINAFKANADTLGLDDYIAYYVYNGLQRSYSPIIKESNYFTVKNYFTVGKYKKAKQLALKILKKSPTNIGVYYILVQTCYILHDLKCFRWAYKNYLGYVMAIRATGSGLEHSRAMLSTASIDELMVLNFIQYDQFMGQEQITITRDHYNIYTVAKNGSIIQYFFWINIYWHKIKK